MRKAPINVQNVITYDVVIGVSNPDLKLFPGMTANVKIMVDQRTDVLKVPERRAAVPSGGRRRPRPPAARADAGRAAQRRRRRSGCWTRRTSRSRCA